MSEWIVQQQELTQEIREFRRVGGRFEFSGLLHIKKLVEKSRIAGAALETTEIRDVLLVVPSNNAATSTSASQTSMP